MRTTKYASDVPMARRMKGFTLLELMATIAVAAIVLGYALPHMHTFMQRNHVVAQYNSMMADLQYARVQAVTTRSYVSVCPLTAAGGTTCDTGSGNYNQGWMIFTATAPGAAYDGVASHLLRVEGAPSTTQVAASTTGILTYDAFGQLWANNQVAATSFTVCALTTDGDTINTTTVPGAKLSVSTSGRVATDSLAAGAACD